VQGLDGQVALVTGGSRGIGRGIAAVLASEGARVVIAALAEDSAEEAAARMREEGHDAVGMAVDVVDRHAVESLVAEIVAEHDRIDIVAANAGIYPPAPFLEIGDEDWDRVMDVNAKGVLHVVQACVARMRTRRYGRVVLTSSVTGPLTGFPGFAHYGASKAAILGLMRSAAVEFAAEGITFNAVLPGTVRTPGMEDLDDDVLKGLLRSIPMREFGDPQDVGWAVRFFASLEARYITGQAMVIDGGQMLPEGGGALDD
jgi:3-oxoacyl-[acyl-carrier protein] reductase